MTKNQPPMKSKKIGDIKQNQTRPAWAGFKTAEEGIAIIMSYIL